MTRLFEAPTGARFSLDGITYKLLNHDNSGSLSAGPGCERESDGETVYLSYIEWGHGDRATMVELLP